eukprot:8211597-Alexandrium_andersonii.AAC.1
MSYTHTRAWHALHALHALLRGTYAVCTVRAARTARASAVCPRVILVPDRGWGPLSPLKFSSSQG